MERNGWLRQFEGANDAHIVSRIPSALASTLERAAEMHGRNVSEEFRLAVEVHVSRSMLAALPDPEIQAQLGASAAAFENDLRADIAALEAVAYVRPTPEGKLVPYEGDK